MDNKRKRMKEQQNMDRKIQGMSGGKEGQREN
jgi:hypothetical protein